MDEAIVCNCRTCKAVIVKGLRCVKCHRKFKAWVAAGCPNSMGAYWPRYDGVAVGPEDLAEYEAAVDAIWEAERAQP